MIAVYTPAAKHVTIDRYQQMGEKGLLTPDDRVLPQVGTAVQELFVDPDER